MDNAALSQLSSCLNESDILQQQKVTFGMDVSPKDSHSLAREKYTIQDV